MHNLTHFIGAEPFFEKAQTRKVGTAVEFSKTVDATIPMIKCRTKDGLELDLEASHQYKVQEESIFKIYTSYG